MDNRAIGVLDTGVGGLTAVRSLRALLPGEDIVFFADTARVPYGGRNTDEIRTLSTDCARRLAERAEIKFLLVACGTITSACLAETGGAAGVEAAGVIAPAAEAAARASVTGRIGVLSTEATARTGAFPRALEAARPGVEVVPRGNSALVPLIEAGRISAGDAELERAVDEAAAPFISAGVDALILGCTHFPLLTERFRERLPGVELINSGAAGAGECARRLAEEGLLNPRAAGGSTRCLVTGDTEGFCRLADIFLGGAFTAEKA